MTEAMNPELPTLDNGTSTHMSHELVSTTAPPPTLLWDVMLPLVVAIAVPLILKRALESQRFLRMFRSAATTQAPEIPEDSDFDID